MAVERHPLSGTDGLTGLESLIPFLEALESSLTEATAAHEPLALLQVDIDNLSEINRRLGHARGDRALVGLAARLRSFVECLDPPGEVYRTGGDELTVLLRRCNRELACERAADLLASIHTLQAGAHQRLSATIGLAAFPDDTSQMGTLLAIADFNVLYAKRQGGNRVCTWVETAEPFGREAALVGTRLLDTLIRTLVQRVVESGKLLSEAQHLAMTDPMTGLPNYRALESWLDAMLRPGLPPAEFSLLLVDGDSLKTFNDMLGYEAADDYIRRLGALLVDNVRQVDRVARWRTGDEFMLILADTSRAEAVHVAERIRSAVEALSTTLPLPATVSIGIATCPSDAADPTSLIKAAESACHRAKRAGKNAVV